MAAVFSFLFGLYWIGVLGFGFYSWLKYTHRGQSDIERRLRASGYGLAWPYFAFRMYSDRQAAVGGASSTELDEAKRRILNG